MFKLFSFLKQKKDTKQDTKTLYNLKTRADLDFYQMKSNLELYKCNVSSHTKYKEQFLKLIHNIQVNFTSLDKNGQEYYIDIYKNSLELTEPFRKQLKELDSLFVYVCFHMDDHISSLEEKKEKLKKDLNSSDSEELKEAINRNISNINLEIQRAKKRKDEEKIAELNVENCLSILKNVQYAINDYHSNKKDIEYINALNNEVKNMYDAIKEIRE